MQKRARRAYPDIVRDVDPKGVGIVLDRGLDQVMHLENVAAPARVGIEVRLFHLSSKFL